MASSQKKAAARRRSTTGIATVSAIAVALGTAAVIPGVYSQGNKAEVSDIQQVADAQFTGGIRGTDGSGAIERAEQLASDIGAGSCTVGFSGQQGSKGGFSFSVQEPSNTSPNKREFGVNVKMDSSKDRTWTDFVVTGSNNNAPVTLHDVAAMAPGDEIVGESITDSTSSVMFINRVGRQPKTATIAADLNDDDIAAAASESGVSYGWKDYYTEDNTDPGKQIFNVADASVSFNPWPSENIECNPITVSWESFEKHVIVPGEETKVGTVNVPKLSKSNHEDSLPTDDSLSRMVVEAYDGNGKFIGTTDPEASGGEQLLRVDQTTGDIYFTWPEYRGTDLATDKNVNFSVLAKPRTVDQLQTAATHNSEFGRAFDSSNSLDRYSKANVIDSKAFSLDDTEYHDPKYDKTDASIISGVDSATGPLATEPQKVTFTQVPDLIEELEKKKSEGGFEAEVTLDEKYVYEGWSVEMDEDYNVTVTAPDNPRPGTFARPVVTVEYSNGSTDKLELLVVVDPNNTQVTDLVRPDLTKGKIGDDLTAQVGTKPIMKGHKPVHPAKFEIDPSTVPEGWTVTVDETGKVTAKADDTVPPGTIITPKVNATYPDGTTDEIETQFQAIVDIKIPAYDTVTNKPNAKVSLTPEVPERGLSGNTADEAPKRYTFPEGKTEYTVEDESGTWTVKIDETTGEISTTIPKTAPEGYILDVPVLAYYDNVDKPQQVKGTVVVLKSDIPPTYSVESTGPNQAVEHQVEDAPKGSTFSFGKNPDGSPITEMTTDDDWKYTIDPETGVVSSTPPADSKPGDKKTINVTVDTPDGSSPKVPVTTVVNLANNWEADPTYPEETVYPGGTAKLPVTLEKPDNIKVAKENPYKLGKLPAGWTATIDDNGQITATAPADAKPGSQVEIPVTVTYEDGSTDTAKAVVNVVDVPTREVPFKVEYKYDDTIPAGESKVETKGEPGAEKQNKDGTWKQTKEPVNEVVVIGTKPAEAAKDVTWKVPLPYPTEVRENPDLKPGETRVVQEGENGEKTYTAKFTAKGDEAEVVEEDTTKEPVKRIVEYGPGLAPSELVTKTEKPVPFETKVTFDDTLEKGEQVVDKQGELGTEVETSTQKIVDGKPQGDPEVSTTRTKEPVAAEIRVGTKTTGETSKTVEADVPFGVKIEFDPSMPAGTSETVTEGKPGKKTVTVTQKITNSKPDGEATVEEKITEEPVDQVIKVGTKPSETSEKITWTAQVPFEVETRPNPDLKPGEVKVVQKGEPGEKTFTADFTAKGDDATVKPEEKQTKDPVNEIIEYGPAAKDTSVVTKTEKPVPFETEIVFDDTLAEGEQKVDQQGETGTEVVTSTQKIVDGKPSGDPEVTTERTKEPKKQIIRVGTRTEGTNTTESEVEVPFETEIQFDDSMPAGTQETVQEGKPGKDKVTTTQTIENSKVTGTTTETERIAEPVKKIIKVGTKGDTTSKTVEWTENTPFEVEVRENPNLKAGETKVVQEGKPGEVKHTVTVTSDNGDITTDDSTETISEPTKQIIEVGTAPSQTELSDKHTEQLPFETIIEVDPELEAGKVIEDQAGAFGEKEVTKVWKLEDGKVVGDPETTENITKEPTPRKLRVGGKVVTVTETETETEKEPAPVPAPELDRGFYGVELTEPGVPASQEIKDGTEGNTYEIGELPAGWTATVDENGTVTATPPADAKSGDYAEIPVTVTPKDGKPYTANAVFIVKEDQPVDPTQPTETEVITAPTYNPAVIEAGDTQTVDINYGHTDGNTYQLGEVPAGWTVTIGETTGQLTVTPPADTPSGTIQEIPVTVTTEDGQTFNVKTVIGVTSDNCGCEPVEPNEPTDPSDGSEDPTPNEPTNPDNGDNGNGEDTPTNPDNGDNGNGEDTPTNPDNGDNGEDKPTNPVEPNDPTDADEPRVPEVEGLWPLLIPLALVPAVLGFFANQPNSPALPSLPLKPQDPKDALKALQPKEPKAPEAPKAPSEAEQPNTVESHDVESKDVQPGQSDNTSRYTGTSPSTTDSNNSTNSGILANTGANVLGLLAAGLALIAGAALLLRPGRRKES